MGSWIEYTESEWRNLNMSRLGVDEAYININNEMDTMVYLYGLSEECFDCPFSNLKKIKAYENVYKVISTTHKIHFKIFDKNIGPYEYDNETSLCKFSSSLGEFGVYNISISNGQCDFIEDKAPVNIYFPILLVFLIILSISTFLKLTWYLFKKYKTNNDSSNLNSTENTNTTSILSADKEKKRLKSLDTVRGIAIVLMIFVNSGGGQYWWIEHAPWNGFHLADIVFPLFLWIMGVCIPISIKSQLSRNLSKTKIIEGIVIRSIKLFLIGLFLNSINGPNLRDLRIMGVLQRFGISYCVVAIFHTFFSKSNYIMPQGKLKRIFNDVIILIPHWIFTLILIIIHLTIVFRLYVPGCPRGYLGPGGKDSMAAFPNCIGGATGYIDEHILGATHIYQHPTAKYLYDSKPFDPEGVFGCLLSIVHTFIGLQCGITILTFVEWKARLKRLASWAIFLGILGGILCKFSKESNWIPINKNLWSLSFVLVTCAIAYILLAFCYGVIDVRHIWNGSPFIYSGMNAIIMYVGHTIMHKMLPWHWHIGLMNTHFVLLMESLWNTFLWMGIAFYLFKKKIFYSL